MENSFRLIVESAAVPIFTVDVKGNIIYANPCAERTFGWDAGELGGHALRTILPQPGFCEGISVPDQCMPHGVRTHTTTGISKTGDEIPVEFSCTRIDEGEDIKYVAIARDISEQRKHGEEISRLAAIVESSDDAILSETLAGIIQTWNAGARKIYGYTADEVIGRPATILVPPGYPEEVPAILAKISGGEAIEHYITKRQKKNGEIIDVSLTLSPVRDADGRVVAASIIARDITEQLKAERRERELEDHKLDFYRRTILAATDGKLDIRPADEIMHLAGERIILFRITSAHDMVSVRRDMRVALVSGGMSLERADLLVLCAGEAMTNALKHAGGGDISLHGKDDMFTMLVSDRGRGIEALNLPDIALTHGYSTAGTLGMGYKLMLSFAGHVYLATGMQGTILGLSMRIHEDTEKPPSGAR